MAAEPTPSKPFDDPKQQTRELEENVERTVPKSEQLEDSFDENPISEQVKDGGKGDRRSS